MGQQLGYGRLRSCTGLHPGPAATGPHLEGEERGGGEWEAEKRENGIVMMCVLHAGILIEAWLVFECEFSIL